jgi:hypothetical protein
LGIAYGVGSLSECEVRTLDGNLHQTTVVGGYIGFATPTSFGITGVDLYTNARTGGDLSALSEGISGSASWGGGLTGTASTNVSDPHIKTFEVGGVAGLGAGVGVGGSFTWVH